MNVFAIAVSEVGAVLLPLASALLLEELTYGGLVRLLLTPRLETGKRGAVADRPLSQECNPREPHHQKGKGKCSH